MKYDEFMKQVLEMWPEAVVLEDTNGELVISTGLSLTAVDTVVPMEA